MTPRERLPWGFYPFCFCWPAPCLLVAKSGHTWPGSEFGERFGGTTDAISATDLIWALATYHFQKKWQNAGLRSMPLASVFEQREKMYRNPVLPLSWSRYSPNRATRPTDSSK
jgi:hypothetical protein